MICLQEMQKEPYGHGQAVMEKVADLEAFIRRWREHFLSTMKPNFLPTGWRADRQTQRPGM